MSFMYNERNKQILRRFWQFVFSAPGPPSNVSLVSDSQHSIMVFIAPPEPVQRNGIIVGYTVFYRQTRPDTGYLLVNTTTSSVRLTNLTVFTEYSVKVAAFTSVGQGRASQQQTIVSQEGSMCVPLFVLIHFKCLVSQIGVLEIVKKFQFQWKHYNKDTHSKTTS